MTWDCPVCRRQFKVKNQSHSCEVRDPDHNFRRKTPAAREIFDKIISILNIYKTPTVSFVKNAIIVSGRSTFLAVKPRRSYVEIEFLLDEEVAEFPIHKTVRVSKHKVAHFIKLETPDEIEGPVTRWILQAYRLNMEGRK